MSSSTETLPSTPRPPSPPIPDELPSLIASQTRAKNAALSTLRQVYDKLIEDFITYILSPDNKPRGRYTALKTRRCAGAVSEAIGLVCEELKKRVEESGGGEEEFDRGRVLLGKRKGEGGDGEGVGDGNGGGRKKGKVGSGEEEGGLSEWDKLFESEDNEVMDYVIPRKDGKERMNEKDGEEKDGKVSEEKIGKDSGGKDSGEKNGNDNGEKNGKDNDENSEKDSGEKNEKDCNRKNEKDSDQKGGKDSDQKGGKDSDQKSGKDTDQKNGKDGNTRNTTEREASGLESGESGTDKAEPAPKPSSIVQSVLMAQKSSQQKHAAANVNRGAPVVTTGSSVNVNVTTTRTANVSQPLNTITVERQAQSIITAVGQGQKKEWLSRSQAQATTSRNLTQSTALKSQAEPTRDPLDVQADDAVRRAMAAAAQQRERATRNAQEELRATTWRHNTGGSILPRNVGMGGNSIQGQHRLISGISGGWNGSVSRVTTAIQEQRRSPSPLQIGYQGPQRLANIGEQTPVAPVTQQHPLLGTIQGGNANGRSLLQGSLPQTQYRNKTIASAVVQNPVQGLQGGSTGNLQQPNPAIVNPTRRTCCNLPDSEHPTWWCPVEAASERRKIIEQRQEKYGTEKNRQG